MNEPSLASLGTGSSLDDNQRQMLRLLFQNPQSLAQLGMTYNPSERQGLTDSANNADMFGVNSIKRMLGIQIDPNTRVSEDFGALRRYHQQRR